MQRPLPTVIGPTENALRALLSTTLRSTAIDGYEEWVALNMAASPADEPPLIDRLSAALHVESSFAAQVLESLRDDGLLERGASTATAQGEAELRAGRALVSTVSEKLVEGVAGDELEVAIRVLDRVRARAEELLTTAS